MRAADARWLGKPIRKTLEKITRTIALIYVFATGISPLRAQQNQRSASELLRHAVYLADLYNWTDAGPEFSRAEKLFIAAGDQRNALYAKLGKIRSTAEEGNLPVISAQLDDQLNSNPLLLRDKQLRMFCFIVKGDIDAEFASGEMRDDWQQVQTLARELGDTKWQYRALAQLGLAAFYAGYPMTARQNVGNALAAASAAGDTGAQIRYLTELGTGLVFTKMYEQALPYLQKALQLASATPDSGYPFLTYEQRLDALIGLKQFAAAQALAADILKHARDLHRPAHVSQVQIQIAHLALAQGQYTTALTVLEESLPLSQQAGLMRQTATAQSLLADIYREQGNLSTAEHFATLAAGSIQASGDLSSVPAGLQTLAEIEIQQGAYSEADRTYDRAAAFVDSTVARLSSVLDKTALIKSRANCIRNISA